jgi:phosphate acetyltransferase
MTPGVYVAGCEPATGKSAVALGVQQLLARRVQRLGVFRPVVADPEHDPLLDLLRPSGAGFLPYEASCGIGYEDVRADEARALEEIVARYRALAAQCDGVLVVGRRNGLRGCRDRQRAGVQRAGGAEPRPAGAARRLRARPDGV